MKRNGEITMSHRFLPSHKLGRTNNIFCTCRSYGELLSFNTMTRHEKNRDIKIFYNFNKLVNREMGF